MDRYRNEGNFHWEPESFVRGGPVLATFFLVDEGRGDLGIQLKAGHHQSASETSFR